MIALLAADYNKLCSALNGKGWSERNITPRLAFSAEDPFPTQRHRPHHCGFGQSSEAFQRRLRCRSAQGTWGLGVFMLGERVDRALEGGV